METDYIQWLRERLPPPADGCVGIGDDAAVTRLNSDTAVVAADLICDGVHFELASTSPQRIGRKALAVNLSDLAAMAATPAAAFVSLLLPRNRGASLAREIAEGMLPLAEKYGVAIAGGDTNSWDGRLAIGVTVLGTPHPGGPLLRGTAQAGDAIFVTGTLGGSLAGRHLDFEPRLRQAILLKFRYPLHAGMDISDGLLLDLFRLTQESSVGAELDLDSVPVSDAALQLAGGDPETALDRALTDGEDFELLVTAPESDADAILQTPGLGVPIRRVGTIIASPGLWRRNSDGTLVPLEPRGYQHRLDA